MENNLKNFLTNALRVIPGYDFLSEMFIFIKHPEIYDGTHEYAPLEKSGANLLKSMLFVGSLIAAFSFLSIKSREGANKQVISSQADSLIKISRIWADFFPANTSNQPI